MDDRGAAAPGSGWDVYANTSTDGGVTFRPSDVRVNATPIAASGGLPQRLQLACAGTRAYAAWSDDRDGTRHVWFNHSYDTGATFRPADQRLDLGGNGVVSGPFVSCDREHVHVAWTDGRTAGRTDVFVNTSADEGASWLPAEVRMDRDVPGPGSSALPRPVGSSGLVVPLCCDGVYPYVVWADGRYAATGGPGTVPCFGTYD
jgi:hypothetical protein